MKKVIFLAIAAAAALTACSKSEVIDSKYGNDMIGFENYLGRDVQVKGAVATSINEAGIYGYYTAGDNYVYTADATDSNPASKANLWLNGKLSADGSVEPLKYWTNEKDLYSFAAYAPKDDNNLTVPTADVIGDPVIKYTVYETPATQIDLLYASALNQKKPTTSDAGVELKFNHALSRLTVTAESQVTEEEGFGYTITDITVSGDFFTSGNLNLMTGAWSNQTTAEGGTTYTILNDGNSVLSTTKVDYAKTGDVADKYLMFIPTANDIKVNVTYTISYAGEVSQPNEKSFTITPEGGFKTGFAYAVNLKFMVDQSNAITFNVSVNSWDETTPEQTIYPEGQPKA